jgi:hypothetical protein
MLSASDGDKSHEEGAVLMILIADVLYPLAKACSIDDGDLKMVVLLSRRVMNIPVLDCRRSEGETSNCGEREQSEVVLSYHVVPSPQV